MVSGRRTQEPLHFLADAGYTHPVGTSSKADALGPQTQREHFRHNDPSYRAPRKGKVADVDPYEDNRGPPCPSVETLTPSVFKASDQAGNDEVTRGHADSTCNQNLFATELVYPKYGRNCEEKLHATNDASGEETGRGSTEAEVVENERAGIQLVAVLVGLTQRFRITHA